MCHLQKWDFSSNEFWNACVIFYFFFCFNLRVQILGNLEKLVICVSVMNMLLIPQDLMFIVVFASCCSLAALCADQCLISLYCVVRCSWWFPCLHVMPREGAWRALLQHCASARNLCSTASVPLQCERGKKTAHEHTNCRCSIACRAEQVNLLETCSPLLQCKTDTSLFQ